MADTIINLVLKKLADAVIQEALFLYGVHDRVEQVKRELTWIQSFLKDADSRRHQDETVKHWVNEVKEVSYLIDDTLDKFLIEAGGDSTIKRIVKLPVKLIAKNKLATQINKIQQRITEISANTTKYNIEGLKDNSMAASSNPLVRPPVIPDLGKSEVIGFEVDIKTIVDQLIDKNITRRSVISIVGAGGSGKTTLAKEVYERPEIKNHFSICLWLIISQEYKRNNILIKLLEGIREVDSDMRQKGEEMQQHGEEHLIRELYNYMKEKRYLLVLDDVWTTDLWTQIHVALPEVTNGSRVLITTGFINIAEEADAISKPYEMNVLNEVESQQLLVNKIFPNQYANECPENLLPLLPQFVKKCGGWPLALVVLGGILSRKISNYNVWDEVMRNINWHTEGDRCMSVISTSYDDLPVHLKPCFMYFAIFPEDYRIKATSLIQLWVAEGFISRDTSKTMEDIVESFLEELVQRCMVQVSSRYVSSKIKYCHIHDLLRELAIQKATEENFLAVLSKNDIRLSGSYFARRVSLHNYGNMPLEHVSTNLRTLNYFGDCQIQSWKRFGMLRVLNTQQHDYFGRHFNLSLIRDYRVKRMERITSFFNYNTRSLKELSALRYFGFEMCHDLKYIMYFKLPPLTHMKNLQTVNISVLCKGDELSMSIWESKQLRHVILVPCAKCQVIIRGPPSSANLQNLLTLKGVNALKEWGEKLPHFPNLRKLGLIIPLGIDPEPIVHSLSNLQHLGSLSLDIESGKQLAFPGAFVAFNIHQLLHSLYLKRGIWPSQKPVDYNSMCLHHLVKLKLILFNFKDDPMPQLEKLPNLTVLILYGTLTNTNNGNQRMICSKRGFRWLQRLVLYLNGFEEWKIEEGAMPMLNQLVLERCNDLKMVPDLQYLTNLRELRVVELVSELMSSKLQGDDQWKIKHISSVIFTDFGTHITQQEKRVFAMLPTGTLSN